MESLPNTLGVYYFSGALFSLLASIFVVFSYLKFKEVRKHPSSLIFWRSFFDIFFSLQFIVLYVWEDGREHCEFFSLLFQFTVLGSQSWYFMLAIDLFKALRDPFTQPSRQLRYYHLYVWGTSFLSAFIIAVAKQTGFRTGMEVCWIKQTTNLSDVNVLNWVLFFIPTLIYYCASVGIMFYAWKRLRQGLDETFKVRNLVLRNGQRYVAAFSLYWTVAGIIYFMVYLVERDDPQVRAKDHLTLYGSFAIILAVRGLIDVSVWTVNQGVVQTYRRYRSGAPPQEDAFTDINRALRKEVILFSTQGICESVDIASQEPSIARPGAQHFPVSLVPEKDTHKAIQAIPLSREDSTHLETVPFFDYAPQVFRHLRSKFGILDDAYKKSILGDTNQMIEKFTEGASGSFFYFSTDGRYIVKTLTDSEAATLLEILPEYSKYMSGNANSLISKFLGFHSIKLYTVKLYFVVMQSVFQTQLRIHTRYDLKGSWVNRHAKDKSAGGVLKDSDLNTKISLVPKDRKLFLENVQRDSQFLLSQGIMDYSLLLGVHNTRQLVVRANQNERKEPDVPGRKPFYQDYNGGLQAQIIEGAGVYFFGIIDILQRWSFQKKGERFLKICLKCVDRNGVSAIPPRPYSRRFIQAMHRITEPDDYADEEVEQITQETLDMMEQQARLSRASQSAQHRAAMGGGNIPMNVLRPGFNEGPVGSPSRDQLLRFDSEEQI